MTGPAERKEKERRQIKNIKSIEGMHFFLSSLGLKQEVHPWASGSGPLEDPLTWPMGTPKTPGAKPTPPSTLLLASWVHAEV